MLKSLFPDVPWQKIKAAGFDIDGTLYDEFDLICNVYREIAVYLSGNIQSDPEALLFSMLGRWLEKGSSYPYIFSEALEGCNMGTAEQAGVIKECLSIFRSYKPSIQLANRVKYLLQLFRDQDYYLFIVSDGSAGLQWNKFNALALEGFFNKEDVCISGDYGNEYQKPALKALEKLEKFKENAFRPEEVVFFGDRNVDREFARKAGFYFIGVQNMYPIAF